MTGLICWILIFTDNFWLLTAGIAATAIEELMPKYAYKVITETGNTGSGVIEADSPDSANNKLTAMGYIPTRVKVIGAGAGFDFKAIQDQLSPIRTSDIILFTKQFRTMIRAGVSMLNIL
ncbi:MAG: hypothetical protein WAU34_10665, partial [Desulfobacterales bacterium]